MRTHFSLLQCAYIAIWYKTRTLPDVTISLDFDFSKRCSCLYQKRLRIKGVLLQLQGHGIQPSIVERRKEVGIRAFFKKCCRVIFIEEETGLNSKDFLNVFFLMV